MAKEKDDTFPQKWLNALPTGWKDSAETYSEEELKDTIVKCQQDVQEVEGDMEQDEHLNALKQEIKDVSGGFRDAIKTFEAKKRYCAHLLRLRGNG